MSRIRRLALAALLLTVSIPVWAGGVPDCAPRLRAAPRSCCGSQCACAKSACQCRPAPAPAGPSHAQGVITPATAYADPRTDLMPSAIAHPAIGLASVDASAAPQCRTHSRPAKVRTPLDRLVPLQI